MSMGEARDKPKFDDRRRRKNGRTRLGVASGGDWDFGNNPIFHISCNHLIIFFITLTMVTFAALSKRIPDSHYVEEDSDIVLDRTDIQDGIERCSKSLIRRLLADRSFFAGTIETALNAIWRQPDGFKVVDRGGNIFHFFFNDEKDVIRIERGTP
ncbi:hypothetical protein PIB30_021583 [Stylosanthes scabra]|uniref:Uncharacterized protein n=1 Tax=Stylosanthes scabra TaxID=79078 RepID=A0ABU6UAP5_9FABA|nr:hypothetical protein [Stylosanthes scabra]